MANATALPLTLPITAASPISQKKVHGLSLWSPKKASCPNLVSNGSRIVMHASQKEQSLAGLTTLALAAAMVIPEIAEAAGPGVSPSLKNFLLKAKQVHGLSLWSPKKASCPNLVSNGSRIVMHASQKEQSLAGLTTLALAAAMVIPEIAEAAGPGVSPSLKNFLLSIAAGGVVVTVIGVAVLGVANFDPVKRS